MKPSIEESRPNDAMIAPPGTPGAATIVMPSIAIKPANIGVEYGIECVIMSARAQATILSVEPDMWIVAHNGITKPAVSLSTPSATVCRNVTGIVAADD